MNRKLLGFVALIALLTACSPGHMKCEEGLCLEMSIGEPIQALKPTPLTLRISSKNNVNDVFIALVIPSGVVYNNIQVNADGRVDERLNEKGISWRTDIQAGKDYLLTLDITFQTLQINDYVGTYRFYSLVDDHHGASVSDSLTIYMNTEGVQVVKPPQGILRDGAIVETLPTEFAVSPWPTRTRTNTPTPTITFTPHPTETPTPPAYPPPPTEGVPLAPEETATPGSFDGTAASYPPPLEAG
jgi:hypothetical protein